MISFRTAQLLDSDKIAILINSAYRGDSSKLGWTTEADILGGLRTDKEMIQEIITDTKSQIELVFDDQNLDELLGCVYLKRIDSQVLYFGMLVVKPLIQNKGIGKKILNHIDQLASHWGCLKITISVIHTRSELISYYERRGFIKTGISEPFPTDDIRYGEPKVPNLTLIEMEKKIRGSVN